MWKYFFKIIFLHEKSIFFGQVFFFVKVWTATLDSEHLGAKNSRRTINIKIIAFVYKNDVKIMRFTTLGGLRLAISLYTKRSKTYNFSQNNMFHLMYNICIIMSHHRRQSDFARKTPPSFRATNYIKIHLLSLL